VDAGLCPAPAQFEGFRTCSAVIAIEDQIRPALKRKKDAADQAEHRGRELPAGIDSRRRAAELSNTSKAVSVGPVVIVDSSKD